MGYEFPFPVPEYSDADTLAAALAQFSGEDFTAFAAQVRTHAQSVLGDENASAEAMVATRDLFAGVMVEETRRTELARDAQAAREELAAGLAPEPTPEPAPTPDPTPEPAPSATGDGGSGGNAALANRPPATGTLDPAPGTETPRVGVLVASADAPGVRGELTDFAQVGALLDTQFGRYGRPNQGISNRKAKAMGGNRFRVGGRSMIRHSIAAIQREYPAEFRIVNPGDAMRVLAHVRNERRLPGGSLAQSVQRQVEAGRSLTAAAGWCAPSEILYDLCSLSSLDGMLDIPTLQASRGGFQIPENGGPNFATIYDAIGDEGDVVLTEYDVINGAEKVCVEVPCPEFVDVRLDVAYLCLTGNLLQQRGYPEAVTQFSQEAITALAHKVNESMIARLVAGSTAPATITEPASSDDAASNLLSAVELAVMDMRYRNRMPLSATVEVVFPAWVLGPIRASLARRRGVAELAVSDAEISAWLTLRGARAQFVYDWQDAFSGGTFGGSSSATAFPTAVTFLVYPAGTWVKGEQDVINLDTVYDNAMLTSNQFTALFVEDGLSAMKMCSDSRLYTTDVPVAGLTACCA